MSNLHAAIYAHRYTAEDSAILTKPGPYSHEFSGQVVASKRVARRWSRGAPSAMLWCVAWSMK